MSETWDLWFPGAGATGMSFARARVDPAVAGDRVLVRAAPESLEVVVRDDAGRVVASGQVRRGEQGPMSTLVREGPEIRLEDGWPTQDDVGRLVVLPGGEAGVLTAWEHAHDRTWWRWSVEFSNAR